MGHQLLPAILTTFFLGIAYGGEVPLYKLSFGPGEALPGYARVSSTMPYSEEQGYGFDSGTSLATDTPFYFSVRAPEEGNYKVTVTFGDPRQETLTTVKAELRRLMVEKVHTEPGKFEKRSFLVNIRRPQISTGGEVRLKDREKSTEAAAWDDKLTLEFNDKRPGLSAIEVAKADDVPTVYIAGDSTSTDQPLEPFNSWGQMLPRFFKPEIAIANHGESGESLRSFLGENRWAKVMSVIKPGDFLLIQMGHNDQKEKGEGVGAFTTYKADLKRMITEARSHGATPILITSMHRLTFDEHGKITNSLGDYPEAVRQAARDEKTGLIDLNSMSAPFYEALGPVEAHKAFAGNDTTHHDNYGSYELAKCVVEGLRQGAMPLARYLIDGLPHFDPAHPDVLTSFDFPASPRYTSQRPAGN